MRNLMIGFQIVCVVINFFGVMVGALQHNALLLAWCFCWGSYSCYMLGKLLQEED
jgi:hypothetical protein